MTNVALSSVSGKVYKSAAEEGSRKKIFQDNLAKIAEHNEQYKQGKVSFTLGVNQFADLVSERNPTQNSLTSP